MVVPLPTGGDTWTTSDDLAEAYPELAGVDATRRQRACVASMALLKDRLRPLYDVDSDDWSPANIEATAPTIKHLDEELASALCYLGQIGARFQAGGGLYDQFDRLRTIVLDTVDAIAAGKIALPTSRRTYNPDEADQQYTNVEDTDPFFDHADETTWPASRADDTGVDDFLYDDEDGDV